MPASTKRPAPAQGDHEFLFLEEVAAYCRAPVGSVRHWIAEGRLRSVKYGRRRMVRRDDLQKFLFRSEQR